jgi:flagellar FliJ protein
MGKTGFRLDQVLKYRKEMEKVSKVEFAEASQELENANTLLKCEEEKVSRLDSEFMNRQQEGITAQELQIYSSFFRMKSVDFKCQRTNIGLLDHEVTRKRETLIDASKGKKMLESLEKKSVREMQRQIAEKEKNLMEEIAIRGRK